MNPQWVTTTPDRSYRSLFRWGDSAKFKHPNRHLVELMRERFAMDDEQLQNPLRSGLEPVNVEIPVGLEREHVDAMRTLVSAENVSVDSYERIKAAYGKTMLDLFRLREAILEGVPDVVVFPRTRADVVAVAAYACEHGIHIQTKGAGSSVTRAFEAPKGGITLDLTRHMKRILKVNSLNETVTVESGILLPELESKLGQAKALYNTAHNYTLGHFPQSFEFASVGGSVVTRGAGQNSTYYGKIEHMVVAQDYVTPAGDLITKEVPAKSTGPDIDALMMGSEGAFGILVSVTLRIRRHEPLATRRFSYMFRDFDAALAAAREVLQSQAGAPSVFRLSDPEETDVALRLYGVHGTPLESLLRLFGYRPGRRCLLIGSADGARDYTRMVRRNVRQVARRFGAFSTTAYVTRQWEKGRFTDPYMRDDLMDFGVIIDTLECATSWDNVRHVYDTVRSACHESGQTIVMTHLSHLYPQGANLYFIFIGKMEREQFVAYHRKVVDAIARSGAALSHHHGIGRLLAPWFPQAIGPTALGALQAVKHYFDPDDLLNAGVLGLGERRLGRH